MPSLRLNINAILDEGTVGKFLVCIDGEATVEDLMSKIRVSLQRSQIEGCIVRCTNAYQCNLPRDERVCDVLRDAEEVTVHLSQEPQDLDVRATMGYESANMNMTGGVLSMPEEQDPCYMMEPSDDEDDGYGAANAPDRPPPARGLGGGFGAPGKVSSFGNSVPGPQECLEVDIQPQKAVTANNGLTLKTLESDWLVENLTPKLREYISSRFKEAHMSSNNAAFISVLMKPQSRLGSASGGLSVHYSIARVDVIEFERLCHRNLVKTRDQIAYLKKSHIALSSLLNKGMTTSQYAQNMLPYKYKVTEEFKSLLEETDQQTFGQCEGFRPVILIDTSGAVGHSLMYVKAAMKRMIYSFLAAKSKFNLVKFTGQGIAVTWAGEMVPPTAQVLREAEEWLDNLKPLRSSPNFLDGLRLALAPSEVDTVFVVAPGLPKRSDVRYIMNGVQTLNIRDVPIHVIGVDCDPKNELDLRRLSEENHGSFRQKRFDGSEVSGGAQSSTRWRSSGGTSSTRAPGVGASDAEQMTIGGQICIIEVMIDEQKTQENDWLEEQKCANRLLLTTATQQAVPTAEQQRALQRKAALSGVARLGGGYLYQDDTQDTQLQDLFGATPRPPWEASDKPYAFDPSQSRPPQGVQRASVPRDQRNWNTKPNVGCQMGFGGSTAVQIQRPPPIGGHQVPKLQRPSMANPWDRGEGAAIRVSQLAGRGQNVVGGGRPLSRGPSHARAASGGPGQRTSSRQRSKSPSGGNGGRARTPRVGGRQVRAPDVAPGPPPNFSRERRWSF